MSENSPDRWRRFVVASDNESEKHRNERADFHRFLANYLADEGYPEYLDLDKTVKRLKLFLPRVGEKNIRILLITAFSLPEYRYMDVPLRHPYVNRGRPFFKRMHSTRRMQ